MRVDKTTATTVNAEMNGMKVSWTRDLADHQLEAASVAFINEISLIIQVDEE